MYLQREPRCSDNLLRQGEIENRPIKPELQLTCLLRKLSTLQQQIVLAFSQTECPTRRCSIQKEMDQIPRSVLLPLHWRFDSDLITVLHPTLVHINCIQFMNPVLQSVLFLAKKCSVMRLADVFFFFFYRFEKYLQIYETHTTSPDLSRKNYCQSPEERKDELRGDTRSITTWHHFRRRIKSWVCLLMGAAADVGESNGWCFRM